MKLATTPEIPRDQWKRPLIPSPFPDGKPVAHARPSSIAMKIADRFNLEQWQMRMVAKGMAIRPDLVTLAHALDPDDPAGKKQLRQIVEDAKEAAGALRGANIGTALHDVVYKINAGGDPAVEEQHRPAIDAYRRCIDRHGIEPVLLEQFVVWPDMRIAGTGDLYARMGGRVASFDLKTSQHDPTSFSMVEYAAQLACYANATHTWDGETADPLPDIDTELAYLIWMPSGGDICELIEVDIRKGRRWVELATEVADAHRDKAVGRRIPTPEQPAVSFRDPIRDGINLANQRIKALLEAGVEGDHIRALWPEGAPKLADGPSAHTQQTIDAIDATLTLLEMEAGLSANIEQDVIDATIERLKALPTDLLAAVEANAKQAEPPVPNLRTHRVTQSDLDRLERWLGAAEREHGERVMQLTNALSPLDEGEAAAIVAWACEQRNELLPETAPLSSLTDLEAERTLALADLYESRDLDRIEVLVDAYGSKADALAAARKIAAVHELPAPKSTADVAGDRVLCALTIHNTRKATQ